MKSLFVVLGLVILTGCVTSPIVPVGRDSYSVTARRCDMCSAAEGSSITSASRYCEHIGKHMVLRSMNNSSDWHGATHSTIFFSCLDANDPEYVRPNMRKDNGVSTTENR
jgi:hypothetical protein